METTLLCVSPSAASSEPSSPAASHDTLATTPSPTSNLLDDIFGSSAPASPRLPPAVSNDVDPLPTPRNPGDTLLHPAAHPSARPSADVTRLKQIHTTTGYRDGIATAREAALQPGFDEGYPLGAALGTEAGKLIGIMEGIGAGVQEQGVGVEHVGGRGMGQKLALLHDQLSLCHRDLHKSSLLTKHYLNEDATWSWPVPEGERASIKTVAAAHPLIKLWKAKVDVLMLAFGIGKEKLETRWVDRGGDLGGRQGKLSVEAKANDPVEKGDLAGSEQVYDF